MLRCLSTMVLSFCFIFFVNICILLYIFPSSFWGVFPYFFYCAFRHHFWGENCYFFSLFQNSHIVFLGSLSLPYYVGEEEGRGRGRRGALPAFVLNNVTFKCNRKRNSLLHIPRQRIQSPIISDFIVYLCRNY